MSIKQHRMITFLGWGGLRLKSVCAGTRTSFFFFSFSLKPWRSFLYIYSYFLSFFLLSPAYKNAESTLPSDLSRRLCVWDFWWLTCCCYCCLFLVETESFRATTTPHSWITFLCFLKIQSFETDILISKFYFHLYFICLFFFLPIVFRSWRKVSTMDCSIHRQMDVLANFWTKNVRCPIIHSTDLAAISRYFYVNKPIVWFRHFRVFDPHQIT